MLAKFTDDVWYRCEVLGAPKDGKFSVVSIDYGTKETCVSDNISEVKDNFLKEYPAISVCCKLHEITVPSDVVPTEKVALEKVIK